MADSPQWVRILYTNHRGETRPRLIRPMRLLFTSNEWHPEPQWMLQAWDLEKDIERTFAMLKILSWDAHKKGEKVS